MKNSRFGWPEDLWFHVDDLSSGNEIFFHKILWRSITILNEYLAHVYLRLPRGDSFETVPMEVVEECASLVKANSIKVFV